jgi:pilus assembly protein Flp/PilA
MMKLFIGWLVLAEDGATMVEYALMVALIEAALVTVVTSLGGSISGAFSSVSSTLGTAS